jgi:FMN phosphatase YigB (HAD superfamily)
LRVTLKAVFFDVGETLVDETRMWHEAAHEVGVPPFTLMGVLGGLAARGERHGRVWEILEVEGPALVWQGADLYPDALPCLARLRTHGYLVGVAGNTPAEAEDLFREHVDVVGSSGRWGVAKPSLAFFRRLVEEAGHTPGEIAYVGDRMDNDVEPALAAGLVAVHVRRGPWGHLHQPPPSVVRIASLDELPDALASHL